MQWDDLRVFLAIAQAGSLRRAARVLGFGQPTVIRHLRQLEQSLGTQLFERTPDGHRLTKGGQHLMPMAQSMADAATATQRGAGTRIPPREQLLDLLAGHPAVRALA